MLTVLESIELSSEYLKKKGIESPRMNAELLLAAILNCKRLDLYLSFDKPLADTELERYRNYIKRRSEFEPLQYIVGNIEFYGLNFIVNPSVLIPRPETELLVERVIDLFKLPGKAKILDIGCGSGNIAISLAVNLPDAEIIATDISTDAISVAKENSLLNHVDHRIQFLNHNIFTDSIDKLGEIDCIVSNPPYVSEKRFKTLQKEIVNYEPGIAVTDFNDGLNFFKVIISKTDQLLNKGGRLFFEISEGQSKIVEELMKSNHFININVLKDYSGIDRIIFGEKQ
jgi:release factor glutamine methyltransferase